MATPLEFNKMPPRDRGPDPRDLLQGKMVEARQGKLRGEIVLRVRYQDGVIQGSQAQVIDNHPAP